jgi:hypothetical protein
MNTLDTKKKQEKKNQFNRGDAIQKNYLECKKKVQPQIFYNRFLNKNELNINWLVVN